MLGYFHCLPLGVSTADRSPTPSLERCRQKVGGEGKWEHTRALTPIHQHQYQKHHLVIIVITIITKVTAHREDTQERQDRNGRKL